MRWRARRSPKLIVGRTSASRRQRIACIAGRAPCRSIAPAKRCARRRRGACLRQAAARDRRHAAAAAAAGRRRAHAPTLRNLRRRARASARHLAPGRRIAIIGGGFIGLELAATRPQARRRGHRDRGAAAHPDARRARGDRRGRRDAPSRRRRRHPLRRRHRRDRDSGRRAHHACRRARRSPPTSSVVGIGAMPDHATWPRAPGSRSTTASPSTRCLQHHPIPDIFAAGDCCSFPLALYGGRRVRLEAWRNAQDQGALAAEQHARRGRGRSRPCRGSGRISMN